MMMLRLLLLLLLILPPTYTGGVPESFHLYNVPYVEQMDPYWCGPASLAIVLNYWGYPINQSVIAAEIYDAEHHLTYISDMVHYPETLGFISEASSSNLSYVKEMLRLGVPVIVLQRFSSTVSYGHYRVVVGYDDGVGCFSVDDPILGENYRIPYKSFVSLWRSGSTFKVENWTLVITPRDDVLKMQMMEYQLQMNGVDSSSEAHWLRPSDWQLPLSLFLMSIIVPILYLAFRGRVQRPKAS